MVIASLATIPLVLEKVSRLGLSTTIRYVNAPPSGSLPPEIVNVFEDVFSLIDDGKLLVIVLELGA